MRVSAAGLWSVLDSTIDRAKKNLAVLINYRTKVEIITDWSATLGYIFMSSNMATSYLDVLSVALG